MLRLRIDFGQLTEITLRPAASLRKRRQPQVFLHEALATSTDDLKLRILVHLARRTAVQ